MIIFAILTSVFGPPVYANYIKVKQPNNGDSQYVVFTKENIKTTDLRKKSKLDKNKLAEYMKKFPSLSGIEDTLVAIQDEYNVNALLVLAIVRLESGNGKSSIAQSRNNLGGLIGYDNSVPVYKSFDSRSDCIIYMANLLSKHYLTEGGRYFSGYTLNDIAKKYSTSPHEWSGLTGDLIYEIQTGLDKIK